MQRLLYIQSRTACRDIHKYYREILIARPIRRAGRGGDCEARGDIDASAGLSLTSAQPRLSSSTTILEVTSVVLSTTTATGARSRDREFDTGTSVVNETGSPPVTLVQKATSTFIYSNSGVPHNYTSPGNTPLHIVPPVLEHPLSPFFSLFDLPPHPKRTATPRRPDLGVNRRHSYLHLRLSKHASLDHPRHATRTLPTAVHAALSFPSNTSRRRR